MYRIMVEGEDHTVFCVCDEVQDVAVQGVIEETEEDYPCGTVWAEEM